MSFRRSVSVTVFLCVLTAVSALVALPVLAQEGAQAAAQEETAREAVSPLGYLDELPPLIDRDLFFGDPEITGSQLSPDGRYLSFIKPYKG